MKAKTMETEKCKIAWVDFSKPYLIAVFIKPASKKKAFLIFGVRTQHSLGITRNLSSQSVSVHVKLSAVEDLGGRHIQE